MKKIETLDLSRFILSIQQDKVITLNEITRGAPSDIEGMTVGLATMETNPPHNGERHNGGDEVIIVISGRVAIESDSNPNDVIELQAGDSCIIRQGEWHKINVVEKVQLVYITPGTDNEYRF